MIRAIQAVAFSLLVGSSIVSQNPIESIKDYCVERSRSKMIDNYALRLCYNPAPIIALQMHFIQNEEKYRVAKRNAIIKETLGYWGQIGFKIGVAIAFECGRKYLCDKVANVVTTQDSLLLETRFGSITNRAAVRTSLEAVSLAALKSYYYADFTPGIAKSALKSSAEFAASRYFFPHICKNINHVVGKTIAGLAGSLPVETCDFAIEKTWPVEYPLYMWNIYSYYKMSKS